MVGTLRGMPESDLNLKIDSLLQLFSLHSSRFASMSTYSKGMRQRILLIAAIMHDPEIFIFDEPLSGLDVTSALIFKNLVQALGHAGKMVFYCSHVLEVVEKVCTDVLILRQGLVIAQDSVANVGKILSQSLENTFLHLVDNVDTISIARDIVSVIKVA
jgi:ABC-2 type transport system ATP-binding protein